MHKALSAWALAHATLSHREKREPRKDDEEAEELHLHRLRGEELAGGVGRKQTTEEPSKEQIIKRLHVLDDGYEGRHPQSICPGQEVEPQGAGEKNRHIQQEKTTIREICII